MLLTGRCQIKWQICFSFLVTSKEEETNVYSLLFFLLAYYPRVLSRTYHCPSPATRNTVFEIHLHFNPIFGLLVWHQFRFWTGLDEFMFSNISRTSNPLLFQHTFYTIFFQTAPKTKQSLGDLLSLQKLCKFCHCYDNDRKRTWGITTQNLSTTQSDACFS